MYPPEPEPKGELPPPRRRPPTAIGSGVLPAQENPQRGNLLTPMRRWWLPRAVDSLFWHLDRVGEDLAVGLRMRPPPTVPKPR